MKERDKGEPDLTSKLKGDSSYIQCCLRYVRIIAPAGEDFCNTITCYFLLVLYSILVS